MPFADVGSEFIINSETLFSQYISATATLSDGRVVVVWDDESDIGLAGEFTNIRAGIFSGGNADVSGFLVNTTTVGYQMQPAVSALADGQFVIVWGDGSSTGGDTSLGAIRGQIFSGDGLKLGGEFLVNTITTGSQFDSAIATLADGHFVVTWTDRSSAAGDASLASVRGQIFTADGAKLGSQFLVNTSTIDSQFESAIAALADGRFVVTWTDRSASGGDTSADAIRGQIFTVDGLKSGGEFLVNSTVTNAQSESSVTALADGRFVVTWTDLSATGGDTFGAAVRGQVFAASGSKSGTEFLINTGISGDQSHSAVLALPDGRFVVSWGGNGSSGNGLYAQMFAADGSRSAPEFLISNDYISVSAGGMTALPNGQFLLTWPGGSSTQFGYSDIHAQWIDATVFVGTDTGEVVTGGTLPDNLSGLGGNDVLAGLKGNDTLDGGAGSDTADYQRDFDAGGTAAVTVNLAAGTATDGFGDTDTLIGIENVRGTRLSDTLIGSSDDNSFTGLAGADAISGDVGLDEVRYDLDRSFGGGAVGVTVNLATGMASDGFGNTDTLASIEAVRGTQFTDTFTGGAADEWFRGLGGNDAINGGGGSDWAAYDYDVLSRQGNQVLSPVAVNLATNIATDSYGNTDTLTNIENAAGGTLADTLTGSTGDNVFRGYAGNDTINGAGGVDTADYSNDKVYGDIVLLNGGGAVTINLTTGTATDGFGSTDTLTSVENAIGSTGNDDFTDLAGTANRFEGGVGNDTYRISDASDQVVEALNGGTDHVFTTLSIYTLANNVEQLDAIGAAAGFTLIGNNLDNTINSALGNFADYIDGGAGADQMQGFDGSDIYIVDNAGDVVTEMNAVIATGGYDVIISTVNHTLESNVEQLVLQGGAASGTGNGDANYLYGGLSGLSLTLDGAGGDDVLFASLAGGNIMTGGSGVDTLLLYGGNNNANGGTGSDIYFTYTASDVISEVGGDGIDTVYSNHSIDITEDIEQVILYGSATSASSGSLDDNNIIYGNSTNGAVNLSGGGGSDVLFGGSFGDTLNGGAGVDLLFGFGGANTLIGGDDTDIYYLESGFDTVIEELTGGFDTIYSQGGGTTTLAANVEQLILYGAANGGLGNGADNYLYGHIASVAVTLDGAGGNDYLLDSTLSGDVLTGGGGNDLLDLRTGGNDFIKYAASGSGADLVYGFDADPAGGQDIIDVSGRGFTGASIGSSITVTAAGADTLVTIGGDTIQLIGVVSTDIAESDFLF